MKHQAIIASRLSAAIFLLLTSQINGQTGKDNFQKIETGNWLDLSYQIVNEKEETQVFLSIEQLPEFPGGYNALAKFLYDTLEYPSTAIKDSIQGRVITKFSIDKNGKVCNIKTIEGVRNDLNSACRKAISEMPDWTKPQFMNIINADENILIQFILPIRFSLEGINHD